MIVKECNYRDMHIYVTQHDILKHFCGYVVIPKDHRMYGKLFDEIDSYVNVHGGVTYAGEQFGKYVVGFDCAHYEDFIPSLADAGMHTGQHVWTEDEVLDECKHLADQLITNVGEKTNGFNLEDDSPHIF